MGVKGLWRILEPVKQHMCLADLRGQIIAVDLSIWIVEAKSVLPPSVTKPHLRNLFFRVLHLLQLGIVPVIVVEGVPPDLKQGVMRKRLKHQGQLGLSGGLPKKIGRTRFQAVHRECCEMLELLGVPFIQAASEAEAMCAFLNRHHIVNGCITNDGDAFLYGARTVYRNFTMNTKDRHVDVYSMDDVETTLGLDRESLVGLAVLLGCDYLPKGVVGVGREMALRLISCLKGESVLQRFNLWRSGGAGNRIGSTSLTDKSGEANICRRALASPGFPYKEVVDEFLVDKDKVPQQQRLIWKRPKMFKLVNYALARLEWPEEYTMSKMLPLLTLFDMDALIRSGLPTSQSLRPFRIVKMRTRQGVSCFEVEWHKIDGDPMTTSEYYTTVEEQEMFRIAFPDIVAVFEDGRTTKTKERRQNAKKMPSPLESDEISKLTECFQNLPMLQEPKVKEIKQQHCKDLRTYLPGKVSSPHCQPKHKHTEASEVFSEFDNLVRSSLRKSKSMASINEKSVFKRQKPPRFVISSDSSDDDYWLDKSVDSSSSNENNKNAPPSAAVSRTLTDDADSVIPGTILQRQELLDLDSPSGDESDSSLESYLPLGQRLALQRQGVINHKSNSRKGTKHSSGFSEKAICSTSDELVVNHKSNSRKGTIHSSGVSKKTICSTSDELDQNQQRAAPDKLTISSCAEKLACNDNGKISNHLNGLPSKLLDDTNSLEDLEKFDWMPDFSLRNSVKDEGSNSVKLCHFPKASTKKSGHTQIQTFFENSTDSTNLSDFPKEKSRCTDSVESKVQLQLLCSTVSDVETNTGSSDRNQDRSDHSSDLEDHLLPRAAAVTNLHCVTPVALLPTVSPWSVRQCGTFGIETSILNDLDTTGRESVLCESTAWDDSQRDLFDYLPSPDLVDVSSKALEDIDFIAVTSSPTMQSTKGGCRVEALAGCESVERRLSCVQMPSLATVSLAERLRLKFGNGTKVETLSHLAPQTIQSSLKAFK